MSESRVYRIVADVKESLANLYDHTCRNDGNYSRRAAGTKIYFTLGRNKCESPNFSNWREKGPEPVMEPNQ